MLRLPKEAARPRHFPIKVPSPCEPSAVPSCEEKGSAESSAEPSPENQGSPEGSPANQGSPEPSYEPEVSYEPSHEGDGQVNLQMKPLKCVTTQSVLFIVCNPNRNFG